MSHAKNIGSALSARLATITVANGYLTDIGLLVARGRRRFSLDDLPACTLVEGPDHVLEQAVRTVNLKQRYMIEAHVACNPDHPNDAAHDIIADLKRAIFGGDRTLGGLVKKMEYAGRVIGPREDGEAAVFAAIEIDASYADNLEQP